MDRIVPSEGTDAGSIPAGGKNGCYTARMYSRLAGMVLAAVALLAAVWLLAHFLPVPKAEPDTSSEILVAAPAQPADCVVGGCSAQLCGERSEMENMVTTCEYRPEYACYGQFSACEHQLDGRCGWTQTPGLQQCLATSSQEIEELKPDGELQVI